MKINWSYLKKEILMVSLLFSCGVLLADEAPQPPKSVPVFRVRGRIIDVEKQPIPFSSVYVTDLENTSKIVKGTLSDLRGDFILDKVHRGKYLLILASTGYKTVKDTIMIPLSDSIPINYTLSPSINKLSEVVVKGTLTKRYADKDVYFLPSSVRKNSSSAFDALKILPYITIDNVNRKISTANGENVKILINGINSDESELLTLKPSDIAKIEYYDLPPSRFATDNVGSVINVITKQVTQGGTMFVNLQNAPFTGFGNDQLRVKYNKGNNQFTFAYSGDYRNYKRRDANSSYSYMENNNLVDKVKVGLDSPFEYTDHNLWFGFINQQTNKYVFSASLTTGIHTGSSSIAQNILLNNVSYGSKSISSNSDKEYRPSLDLYFEKKITKNQDITFDVVSTYFHIRQSSNYLEQAINDAPFINSGDINGNKFSSIIEGIYSIRKGKNLLNVGVRGYFANSNDKFLGSANNEFISSKTNSLYEYVELIGGIHKWSYQLSAGSIYNGFQSVQLQKKYNFFSFRPSLNVSYALNPHSQLKLTSLIDPYMPQLSQLSSNIIFEDSIMAYAGNPALKPYNKYEASLTYALNMPKYNLSTSLNGFYAGSIILPEYMKENSYFVQTFVNQKWEKKVSMDMDLHLSPFKSKWVELDMYGELYKTINKGIDFENNRVDYQYQSSLTFNYSNFSWICYFQNGYNDLQGEILQMNAATTYTSLQYKKNNLTLACGLYYPFEKSWNSTSESYKSPIIQIKERTDIYDNGHMLFFNLVYNFSFGRNYQVSQKKISNQDNDPGILQAK